MTVNRNPKIGECLNAACSDGVHRFAEMALCRCGKQGSQRERAEGRDGMVTVYDSLGQYVGCMGVETWRKLLSRCPCGEADPAWCEEEGCMHV